jgi:ABC-type amino acid transport substrate-binding protein
MKMPLLRQALGILFGSFLTVSAWGAPPPASPDMSAPPPAIEAPPGYKPPPSTLEKIRNFGAIYVGHRESSIPFSYMDDQGKIYGFSWELCERIVDAVKARLSMPALTVVPVLTNPGTRIMMVETGTLDLYCGSATNTEQRARYVSFSNTYFVTGIKGLVRKESGIKSAVDLRGKTIITTAGTTTDGYVKAATTRRNIFVNFRSARTHIDAFHQVLDGKADLFALDDILLQGLLATEDPNKAYKLVLVDENFGVEDYLEKILNAQVYDVAVETPLDLAPNLSARIGNRICSSARTCSRCSPSSCAAPTTRSPSCRRRSSSAA